MSDIKKRREEFLGESVPIEIDKTAAFDKKKETRTSITTLFDAEKSEGSLIQVDGYDETLEWTETEEKKVRRKIDFYLLPFMLLMSFVLNMDRTNHTNAISDNMAADLGFTNDGVNNAILAHSIIFTVFTVPSNYISKRFGAYRWLPSLMTSWAIVTWAHVLIHNYGSYMTVRVLIAVTEAGFVPGSLQYLTTWYKTRELGTRLAIFWGVQSFASAFSGLISFGIFRLSGVAGLEGWKWLFLVDGLFTHIVGFIAFFYLPKSPMDTKGYLRGRKGWFTEREARIAVTRVVRDDLSKTEQDVPITWDDAKQAVSDTKLWTHLITTFVGIMTTTPITTYLPSIIRDGGFPVTTANLLTVPPAIIGLALSIAIAYSSDKYGEVALHSTIGVVWELVGYATLRALPINAGRWSLFAAATVTASAPNWHGMHIAYMSANIAPSGKRAVALGAIVGAANLCGTPGSQIYRVSDAPRYPIGNTVCVVLNIVTTLLFISQRVRYSLTNKYREKKWNSMSDTEKEHYNKTTKHKGSNRLDYRFRI